MQCKIVGDDDKKGKGNCKGKGGGDSRCGLGLVVGSFAPGGVGGVGVWEGEVDFGAG